jgi:hypothetical protein
MCDVWLLSWLHELMLQRQTAGGLRMPAPILACVYTVSDCIVSVTVLLARVGLLCEVWLLSWVHELMLQRQKAGGLRMPAPVLARVYMASICTV